MYNFLANLTAITHGLFVMILMAGVLLAVPGALKKWPIWEKIYLGSAFLTIISFILFGSCFFTDIEKWLRNLALPSSAYQSGFISHYLGIIGFSVPDIAVFWFLVSIISLGFLATIWWHWLKKSSQIS